MNEATSLALADAVPGMTLAEALCDETGHVLAAAGVELSESLLLGLARRQVEQIWIIRQIEADADAIEAFQTQTKAELDHLFRQAGEEEETRDLYRAILAFRLEQGA